jgi:glycosyltransferase involved in cell wall biosynthesis
MTKNMKTNFFSNKFLTDLNKNINRKKKNNYPKISIVMPSYNQAKFIEKSILSVLNQDYPNIEFIIIDGDSKDGTADVIQKYKDKITLLISEKDKGQSDALNKGFKHCTGEIYGWLNSDDIYLPGTFQLIIEALKKNPNKKIIFGDWISINKYDDVIDFNHAFDFNHNHFKYEGFHLNAQSMFWRSDVHKRFSGFDIRLYNTMDYQMILEFGINEGQKSFFRIPHPLGGFRRYEGQKTGEMLPHVIKEHKLIANRYGYQDKYKFIGKIKRLYFRIRRAFWYIKRGGLKNLIYRLKKFYVNHR